MGAACATGGAEEAELECICAIACRVSSCAGLGLLRIGCLGLRGDVLVISDVDEFEIVV
jgi:hypothetical protein